MTQLHTVSAGVTSGLEQIWQPLSDKTGLFNRELSVKITKPQGRELLNAVKNEFETAYLLRMTKILQEHTNMSESQIHLFSRQATESLDSIAISLFNPEQPASRTVKAQLKMAVKEMESAMQQLERTATTRLWGAQVQAANLGKLAVPNGMTPQDVKQQLSNDALVHFGEQADTLQRSIPDAERSDFRQLIKDIHDCLQASFADMPSNEDLSPRLAAKLMDQQLSNGLEALTLNAPVRPGPPTPLLALDALVQHDGDVAGDNPAYRMTREAPLENLVFRGGGGKGRGYLKTLEVMAQHHMFDNVKKIAGSSAGALTAVGLGCGFSPKKLEEFTGNIQKGLAVDVAGVMQANPNAYPGLNTLIPAAWAFGRQAAGVVQSIDKMTAEHVSTFLQQHTPPTVRTGQTSFTNDELGRLTVLGRGYDTNVCRISDGTSSNMDAAVTFNDLALLRRMPGGEQFKSLTLTGWNTNTKRTCLFDEQNTPHMPLALAARASMALPWAFRPVELNLARYANAPTGEELNEPPASFVDGGLALNLPCTVFIPFGQETSLVEEAQAKTLSFVFDNEGLGTREQSKAGALRPNFWENWGIGLVLGSETGCPLSGKNYYFKCKAEQETLGKLGNVMVVGHGKLGTRSFDPTDEQLKVADSIAVAQAQEYVRQHKHQLYSVVVKTPEEAAMRMSTAEKQVFRQQYAQITDDRLRTDFLRSLNSLCA